MIIEYEWVNREPFLEYNSHKVQNWLFQFCAKGWLTETGKLASSGEAEAIAYKSLTMKVEKSVRRHVTGYSSGEVSSVSEAYRTLEKWDNSLMLEVSGELHGPRVIPNWDRYSLQVSGELDL
jgi:hypothetical protein